MSNTTCYRSARLARGGALEWLRPFLALLLMSPVAGFGVALAHEGHEHDKPPPLNLPVAPRVTAVTPDLELVGVVSGNQRLTIFLHRFTTNEPVKDAKLTVSSDAGEVAAVAKDDGVFEAIAPWINAGAPLDLVFSLTLPDGQDVLTGRLENTATADTVTATEASPTHGTTDLFIVAAAAGMAGVLLTLLLQARFKRRRNERHDADLAQSASDAAKDDAPAKVKRLHRTPHAVLLVLLPLFLGYTHDAAAQSLPSVPATIATDVPQRAADATLFVPKATQHLLSVRTVLTGETSAPRTVELVGTVVPDPNSFGRVQTGHAGRVEAPDGGLAFLGKRVTKGDVLAYLEHHIEAYNRGSLQGELAELQARIAAQETKLARLMGAPLAIPPIKIDEAKGELEAQRQKYKELKLTLVDREEIRAPISGTISAANVVAGQVVDAREVMFEIVDPARFWVEAIAHDPSVVANFGKAFAVTSSGAQLPLEFAGLGLSLKQQAAPVSFKITQVPPDLTIGKPVTVILQSATEQKGIVLPASSVVRAQSGLPIVWVKTEPERFEPRTVQYVALDGKHVVVTAGLKPEIRVVTEGATLLNQIR